MQRYTGPPPSDPGQKDDLGYILPLDIRRPRPLKPPQPPPSREEIERRRDAYTGGPFPEFTLSADDGHTQNETSIAISGQTLVAGWNAMTDEGARMGVGRSGDFGASWSSALIAGHNAMSDPVVASAGQGRWFFAYIASGGATGSDFDVFVRRSDDDGLSWQAPVAVTVNATFDDKPHMAARGDEVLVGYADFSFSPARVRAARSLDGGQSFGNDTVLITQGGGNGALPLILADGTYLVFWRDSMQAFFWLARSHDQGDNWSEPQTVVAMSPLPAMLPGGFRIINLPVVAVDPLSGDLVLVWNDQAFGNPDILSIRSVDDGQNWSAPIRVNDDAGDAAQFFPWVTIDEAGIVHVVWYDRRHDAAKIDVYTTTSNDGGLTYEPNTRVTAQGFEPILPWEPGLVDFIGDYNGIAAAGGRSFPCYQDAREGNQDVFVAVIDNVLTYAQLLEAWPEESSVLDLIPFF